MKILNKIKNFVLNPNKKRLVFFVGVVLLLATCFFVLAQPVLAATLRERLDEACQQPLFSDERNKCLSDYAEANSLTEEDMAELKAAGEYIDKVSSTPKWVSDKIAIGLSWLVYGLAIWVGWTISFVLSVLNGILSFNNYVDIEGVKIGWEVVRDLCNMFFVVVLLVIAIATILRIESYNYKKYLPKLILMAILINFSLIITSFIIDLFQILMNAFIKPISQTGGFLVDSLGIQELLDIDRNATGISGWSIFIAILLALAMLIVALVVITVLTVIFVFRIIMLWLLIVLSPAAYLLAAFPRGETYAKQWWDMFIKWVTVGPLLAFFLWLGLYIAATKPEQLPAIGDSEDVGLSAQATCMKDREEVFCDPSKDNKKTGKCDGPCVALVTVGAEEDGKLSSVSAGITTDKMYSFMISIALMIGGMSLASSVGGMAGSFASGAIGKLKSGAFKVAGTPFKPLMAAGGAAGRLVNRKFLESKALRILTPTFWQGFGAKGRKLLEQERKVVTGAGEEFGEKLVDEAILGRTGSARRRTEDAERSVVSEIKSEYQKELTDSGFSRQKFADLAMRAFNSGGKEGERRRQAFLEMAAASGNFDDVFEYVAPILKDKVGLTDDQWKHFGPDTFKTFAKGFMFNGDIEQANKYDPESILAGMAEKDEGGELQGAYAQYLDQGRDSLSDDQAKLLDTARGKAREQADKNMMKADTTDQMRLNSFANISEQVKKVGHWEQLWGAVDPKTGRSRLRDTEEHIEEVVGESQKMGMPQFLSSFAPHNWRPRVWDEDKGEYMLDYDIKSLDPYQMALWSRSGPFKIQQAGETRKMQTRIPEQLFGPFYNEHGQPDFDPERLRNTSFGRIKKGENKGRLAVGDLKGELSDEEIVADAQFTFAGMKAMNEMWDIIWQTKHTGGKPDVNKDTTFSYAHGAGASVAEELRGKYIKDPTKASPEQIRIYEILEEFEKTPEIQAYFGGRAPAVATTGAAAEAPVEEEEEEEEEAPLPMALNVAAYEKTKRLQERASKLSKDVGEEILYTQLEEYDQAVHLLPEQMEEFDKLSGKKARRKLEQASKQFFSAGPLSRLSDEELKQGKAQIFMDFEDFEEELKGVGVSMNMPEATFEKVTPKVAQALQDVFDKKHMALLEKEEKGELTNLEANNLKQLEAMEKSKSLERLAKQGGSIRLLSVGAGRQGMAHGMGHQDMKLLDQEGTMQQEWWDQLSDEEKTRRQEKIEKGTGHKYDLSKKADKLAIAKENAAIMYANESASGDKSAEAIKFSNAEKSQLQSAADKSGIKLSVPIEVEPEMELEKIPSEMRAKIDRFTQRFKKQPPKEGKKEWQEFRTKQDEYSENITNLENEGTKISDKERKAHSDLTNKARPYNKAKENRENRESELEESNNKLARHKKGINTLIEESKKKESEGRTAEAKKFRTDARRLQEDYNSEQKNNKSLQKQLAKDKQKEDKASQNMRSSVQKYDKASSVLDKNKRTAELTKQIKSIEQDLFADEHTSVKLDVEYVANMAEVLPKLKSELEGLTSEVSVGAKVAPAKVSAKQEQAHEAFENVRGAKTEEERIEHVKQVQTTMKEMSQEEAEDVTTTQVSKSQNGLVQAMDNEQLNDIYKELSQLKTVMEAFAAKQTDLPSGQKAKIDSAEIAKLLKNITTAEGNLQTAGAGYVDNQSARGQLNGVNDKLTQVLNALSRDKGGSIKPGTVKNPPKIK